MGERAETMVVNVSALAGMLGVALGARAIGLDPGKLVVLVPTLALGGLLGVIVATLVTRGRSRWTRT
jgi:hypothetical protein